MNTAIDRAFEDAITDGVFPSADLVVARKGEILYASHYGNAREHTCFDIASLTKPICTSTLAMMLIAEGLLKPDDTVYQWLGGAREAYHKSQTIHHLLNHTAGLPAWQPYYRELPLSLVGTEAGKRLILDSCYAEPLTTEVGEKTLYSDIDYIMLGEIVEQAGGESLDALFMQRIVKPLGLVDTFFVRIMGAPLQTTTRHTATTPNQHVPTPKHGLPHERSVHKDGEHQRFAPTEDCPWRGRVIHGEVHDQNAYALGGVAGHAGLFSTASDLHRFTLEFVRCYGGKSDWIPMGTVHKLIGEAKTKPSGEAYIMGWNRPSKKNSASGRYFSANSIGHLGYTGCSIWIDLKEDFWIIILTNRIHPSTTNQRIKTFRPMIHDLIYKEVVHGSI